MQKLTIVSLVASLTACGAPLQQRLSDHTQKIYQDYINYAKFTEAFLKFRSEDLGLELSKEKIKKQLKDPDSANFRNVRYVSFKSEGRLICGEYNAKNSYGAYVGYRLFVGSPAEVTTEQENPNKVYTKTLDSEALRVVCSI